MKSAHGVFLIRLTLPFCCVAVGFASEQPERLRTRMDEAVAIYKQSQQKASSRLLEALETQAKLVAANKRIPSADRDALVAAIDAEKMSFQRYGTLPFSPVMRSKSLAYLRDLNQAQAIAEKAFDESIAYYRRRQNDVATAQAIADEKKTLVGHRHLGTWTFKGRRGTYSVPLFSDGTAGPDRVWSLGTNEMIIRHHTQAAPKGMWVDKGVVRPDGRRCEIRNQLGIVKEGTLSDPKADKP